MSIILDGITKCFGTQLVVDRLSLQVKHGELFVLLGASGSGKSTVLRMIAGLTPLDAGRIVLQGTDVTALPPQQRGTGFVFQNYSIFRHMTVAENIEFGLRIRHEPAAQRVARREQLLELVGLRGLGQRRAHQLSGGQLQRVALARALAYGPKVLLLDEPFGALDVKIRAQVRQRLREIQRALNVTAILVTHDQEEAFELGDRIGVMHRGHLLEVGPPETLYRNPRTPYVATFLGAGNILVGRARAGKAVFGSIVLPLDAEAPHGEEERVEMLMRPEDLTLRLEPPAPDESGSLCLGQGDVIDHTFAGPVRRLRLRLPRIGSTRQTAPPVPFGETGLVVDALQPAETPLPEGPVYVTCDRWRVLQQSRPRVLLCTTPATFSEKGADWRILAARAVCGALGADLTLLAVCPDADQVEGVPARLAACEPGAGVHTRVGDPAEQALMEQQESNYHLVVVDAGYGGRAQGLSGAVRRLAGEMDGALLVVRDAPTRFERLLVCTAGGEPGTSSVRLGAWLARRAGARVTLLYVLLGGDEPSVFVRSHLERAEALIRALDVPVEIVFKPAAAPAAGIIEAAADHDLVVMGGHGPATGLPFASDDVTQQVLAEVMRPVIVTSWEPD